VKSHNVAPAEGSQGADTGSEAVGSEVQQHKDPSFHLGHVLAVDFERIECRNLRVSAVETYVLRFFLRRTSDRISTWAVFSCGVSSALRRAEYWSGHTTAVPGDMRLCAASLEAASSSTVLLPFVMGFSVQVALL
jgi:hypothetical protein